MTTKIVKISQSKINLFNQCFKLQNVPSNYKIKCERKMLKSVKSSTEKRFWMAGTFVFHSTAEHFPQIITYSPYRELLAFFTTEMLPHLASSVDAPKFWNNFFLFLPLNQSYFLSPTPHRDVYIL